MNVDEKMSTFVDALLSALGLKSITTEPAPQAADEIGDLNRTGVYGLSRYSTKNRQIMLDVLAEDPRPTNLAELHQCLVKHAETHPGAAITAIVEATRRESAKGKEVPLDEFAETHLRSS